MYKYVIEKSPPLSGEIFVSGSKNAALPIMCATILTDGVVTLKNIPHLTDIENMCDILRHLGSDINFSKNVLTIYNSDIKKYCIPYELASKLRGSVLLAGPLVSKCQKARITLPGGCPIGTRPIDLHLKGLALLGVKITQGNGYIDLKAKTLKGAKIYLDYKSVGATENIMMASVLACGTTIIQNASSEPEVIDLANFLIKCGAKIKGAGTDEIIIEGVTSLKPTTYSIIPDRIEAGTFMVASLITGGDVLIKNVIEEHLSPITAKLKESGAKLDFSGDSIRICSPEKLKSIDIKTMPHPGFPTDMQALMMSLLCICDGTSIISETVFENRFLHAPELLRMGASIKTEGKIAVIEGCKQLTGTKVKATDLRAGAALSVAALNAKGKSEISDIYHIERGYENFEGKLEKLGVKIIKKKV